MNGSIAYKLRHGKSNLPVTVYVENDLLKTVKTKINEYLDRDGDDDDDDQQTAHDTLPTNVSAELHALELEMADMQKYVQSCLDKMPLKANKTLRINSVHYPFVASVSYDSQDEYATVSPCIKLKATSDDTVTMRCDRHLDKY